MGDTTQEALSMNIVNSGNIRDKTLDVLPPGRTLTVNDVEYPFEIVDCSEVDPSAKCTTCCYYKYNNNCKAAMALKFQFLQNAGSQVKKINSHIFICDRCLFDRELSIRICQIFFYRFPEMKFAYNPERVFIKWR